MDKQEQESRDKGGNGKNDILLAHNRNGDLHMRKVRSDGWSEEERGLFLDMLAATCNVDMSAKAAGHIEQSASALRRRDAGFREQWDEALETGYARLEAKMLEKTQAAMSAERPVRDQAQAGAAYVAADDITIKDAMALLDRHRSMVSRIRQGKDSGYAAKTASAKDSYKEIVKRLQVLKKRLGEGE